MKQDSTEQLINNSKHKDGNVKILKIIRTNINKTDEHLTQNITKENIISIDNKNVQRIQLYKVQKNIIKNEKYKLIIKKLAKNLKNRKKLPQCKIFKFFLSYRTLILRIAKGLKKTAKNLNFWEKWENKKIEQELDIDQIQEIASTACKIIQEGPRKSNINKKKLTSSGKKNRGLKLTLFTKDNKLTEKEELIINNDNTKNKDEIHKDIMYLRNLNTEKNMDKFINDFSSFLKTNNIDIIQDSKLPTFPEKQNNKYLLCTKIFWIKYIIYISHIYKNDLTIYNYINFIEQFYIWNNNNIQEDCNADDFNMEIKKQINNIFTKDEIKNFLLLNKINNLDDLFQRYNIIHKNKNFIEAKIDNNQCQCPTCANNGFIHKIINYNKTHNKIRYSKENNLSYIINNNNAADIEEKKLNAKYYDTDLFDYLNKIEKRKKYEDENENKNEEKKEKSESNKKKSKDSNSRNKNKNKNKNKNNKKSNYNVQDIFDLLSIDGDFEL